MGTPTDRPAAPTLASSLAPARRPMSGSPFFLFFLLAALALGLVLLTAAKGAAPLRLSAAAAAIGLPVVFLGLFASFAVHMHRALGGWPEVIGTRGFPSDLVLHFDIAAWAFTIMLLGGMTAWPLAVLLCAVVPRMRPGLRYLGLYAVACGAALALMQLAPDPFLDWWWD